MAANRIIWLTAMILVVLFAFWRGRRPERLYAVLLVAGSFATRFAQDIVNLGDPQLGILAVDVVLLAIFLAMAMTTDRWWLLFATAFQLVEVVTHAAMILDAGIEGLAYMRGLAIWGYLSLLSLFVGVWLISGADEPAPGLSVSRSNPRR